MKKIIFLSLLFFVVLKVSGCWSDRPLSSNPGTHAPAVPFSPNPPDNAVNVPRFLTLSWNCSDPDNDPLTYDVYLDISNPPAIMVSQGTSSNTFQTGLLPSSSVLFWKIIAKDGTGEDTEGPVWRFTTTQ
jgi:hypothetical protein